jgi:hypothetical protein
MAARTDGGLITFGVINIIIACLPICCGLGGASNLLMEPAMVVPDRNVGMRDIGPQFKDQIKRDVPHARYEAAGAILCNSFLCVLLMVGAIGLFLTHSWGRWLSLGSAILLILTLCVHDIYVFAILRPVINNFMDAQVPAGPGGEAFKFGFTSGFFCWSYLNPVVMIYLVGMCIYLAVTSAFDKPDRKRIQQRRRDDDDNDDSDDDNFGRRWR